jgi:hypothetical protein
MVNTSHFKHAAFVEEELRGMEFCCDSCNGLDPKWYYKSQLRDKYYSMCLCYDCAIDLGLVLSEYMEKEGYNLA